MASICICISKSIQRQMHYWNQYKNSINGVFHFTLFNLSGQLIEEQYVRDKVEVAANNLSDNIYLYRIEYAGDLVSAGKIIKN